MKLAPVEALTLDAIRVTGQHHFGRIPERGGLFPSDAAAVYEVAKLTGATSGVTTYAANRSLRVAAPDADGKVILDFNRATNLPCAYTEFATCPLPPAANRLPVAVEAGEQIPCEAKKA